jgi:hypothetical protein
MYKITYTGNGTHLQIGPFIFEKNSPKFLGDDDLPLGVQKLRKLPDLLVEKENFTSEEMKTEAMKKVLGIKWIGSTSVKDTKFGRFTRDVLRYDLTNEQIESLIKSNPYFVKV